MLLGQAILALNLVQVSNVELDCNKHAEDNSSIKFFRLMVAKELNYADIYIPSKTRRRRRLSVGHERRERRSSIRVDSKFD